MGKWSWILIVLFGAGVFAMYYQSDLKQNMLAMCNQFHETVAEVQVCMVEHGYEVKSENWDFAGAVRVQSLERKPCAEADYLTEVGCYAKKTYF